MTEAAMGFEALAADYDAAFTQSVLGGVLRERVWRRLAQRFHAGDRVLELNCGTGEDAIHLARRGIRVLATDASPAMLAEAERKVRAEGVGDRVTVRSLTLEAFGGGAVTDSFDGVVSNFGGLNCVADLRPVLAAMAACLPRGGRVVATVMGPIVPLEWLWFLTRGDVRRAFRRLRPGGTAWRGLTIRYPTIRRFRHALAREFDVMRVNALGAVLPPTYYETLARRLPRLTAALDAVERTVETVPGLAWLADHYVIELERR